MEMLPETPALQGQPLRRFTRVEYEKLIELGILGTRERAEFWSTVSSRSIAIGAMANGDRSRATRAARC